MTFVGRSRRVVVQSRIVSIRREATELGYVMSQTPAGCKVLDVLAAGSIRVAGAALRLPAYPG